LRALNVQAPNETEIYRTLSYYLREVGRADECRRMALSRTFAFPDEPEGYLEIIYATIGGGQEEQRAKAVDDYLRVFAQKPDSLLRLALVAANEGIADFAWRVVALCPAGSVQARSATILSLEAELSAKNYADADAKAAKVLAADSNWPAWQRQIIQGLQGTALLGLGRTTDGQGLLVRVLDGTPLPPAAYASLAKQIRRVGDPNLAARFYRRALAIDASQGGALVELLEIELQAGTLDNSLDLVERLPDVRKPSAVFMRHLLDHLESDRYLYVPARQNAIDKLERRLAQMRATSRF
jgi:tetratricopeptide (TPR) repeat protein